MSSLSWRLIMSVLVILALGLPAHSALAQQRCFADTTPHCLDAPFGAYWQTNGSWDLYVMKADGSSLVRLTSSPGNDMDGNWSPDGKKILFTSTRGSTASPPVTDLYVMNADGSATVNLTNSPGDDRSGDWSPDGRKIVFTSTRDHHPELAETELYIMNSDGRAVQRITTDRSNEHNPTWSPDGTAIALTQRENTGSPHHSINLMVIKPDGSNLKQLWGRADGGIRTFDWSPDSTSLVFEGYERSRVSMWTIHVTGNNLQEFAVFGDNPVWATR